jgi:2-methylcitrate dehydratase PrpD
MHSMAIACSMGAGLTESNRRGGASKQLNAGWAAQVAITAASMASHGVIGPQTVLEGRLGFVEAYCRGRWDKAAATAELGTRWDTMSIYFRPYPCNNFTQAVADAALMLREQGLRARDVAHVVIGIADARGLLVGDSVDQHRNPEDSYRARFSAPYVFAAAMVGGGGLGVGLEDFTDEAVVDPTRRRISNQCDVVVDETCAAVFPRQILADVKVVTASGTHVEARVTENRGGLQKPLTADEFDRKLRSTAGRSVGALRHAVEALPSTRAVDRLMHAIAHKTTHAAMQGRS